MFSTICPVLIRDTPKRYKHLFCTFHQTRHYTFSKASTASKKSELPITPQDNFDKFLSKIRTSDYLPTSLFTLMNSYKVTPDTNTCNKLIDLYSQDNNLEVATNLLRDMKQFGVTTNTMSYNPLIKGNWTKKDTQAAFGLWEEMAAEKVSGDKTTYHVMFALARTRTELGHVLRRLCSDFSDNVPLQYEIVVGALDYYGKSRDVDRAILLFYELGRSGINPESSVYNIMIEMCVKLDREVEATKFYQKMQERQLVPNTASCNALINMYGKKGEIQKIIELEKFMKEKEIPINTVTSFLLDIYTNREEPPIEE